VFLQKHSSCEQKLLEVRTRKAECRERLEQYREELVRIMHCIKAENASINALSAVESEVISIEQDNQRVKAAMGSSLQELKTGQALLSKDLGSKVRAVELALARGCNILDAVMTRKHERLVASKT
jgi:chromosome segregation ATPase